MGCFASKDRGPSGVASPLNPPAPSPESQLREYIQAWPSGEDNLVGESLGGDSSVVGSLPAIGLAKEYGCAHSLHSQSVKSLASKSSLSGGLSTVGLATID